jgi:hypothetical protein
MGMEEEEHASTTILRILLLLLVLPVQGHRHEGYVELQRPDPGLTLGTLEKAGR